MTEAEQKMKSYEREGFKLYKYYKQDEEVDPDVPSLREYLTGLYDAVTREMEQCNDKDRYPELHITQSFAKIWLNKPVENLPPYCFIHVTDTFEGFELEEVEEKFFNLVKTTAKSGKLEVVPIYRKYMVYKMNVPGTRETAYVPVEDYDIDGHKVLMNLDTVFLAIPSQWW